MKWLEAVGIGLLVTLASVVAVTLVEANVIGPTDPYSDGFGQLALLAIGAVTFVSSFVVAVVLMPILIASCEDCFKRRQSIVASGAAVAVVAVPYWISEDFVPDVLIIAAGPFLSAVTLAIIAHGRAKSRA